jgi:hypothetical protein
MQQDDQAEREYRRLPSREIASMLRTIGAILLTQVRAGQQDGQDWTAIVRQVQASQDDDTRMALYQLNRLYLADRLEEDEPRRAAGLGRDDMAEMIGLLPDPLAETRNPRQVEGRLIKNAAGRYTIEGDPNPNFYFNAGDPIEVYLYDERAGQWQWVATHLNHQQGDYYASIRPDVKLSGVTARRYTTFS